MKDKLKQLEIKRLLQEYTFILTDIEYKNEIISENKVQFLEKAGEIKKEMFPDLANQENPVPPTESKEDSKKSSQIEVSETTKSKIKKMYREIVKLTHPDKPNSEKYLDLHMRATKASEENNLFDLYSICLELNIPLELDSDDTITLSSIIEDKRKNNKILDGSFIWLWINAQSDQDRDIILKAFVRQTNS
jgi:hypothetical protein